MPQNSWRFLVLFFLGILLFTNTLSLGGEPWRMIISDCVLGTLFAVLGLYGFFRPSKTLEWVLACLAAYLLIAPFLLWSKNPATYLNDNLIGAMVFTLAVLFSPEEESASGGVPLGWSFNPSTYGQRLSVITLAYGAYLFSRYMAFYELGYIDAIWDPVFGNGTKEVVTSTISKMFPIPDAGLGSWVYSVEVLMGIHGSKRRWHTIPWFVTFFAILVIPAGFVSVVLITLQPLVVGAYCFWCLITALAMLFMIAFAADEVAATLLFLASVRRRGGDLWTAFWFGDKNYETAEEKPSHGPKLFYGISFPWNLVLSAVIGFLMMFFPYNPFDTPKELTIEATLGALIITFSVISFGEVLRVLRFFNIILGLIFAILAAFTPTTGGIYYHVIVGVVLILLAIPRGKIRYKYGNWNRFIV